MKMILLLITSILIFTSKCELLHEEILEKLLLDYDDFIIPQYNGSTPVHVKLAVYVVDMNPRNTDKLYDHIFTDLIIQQRWVDYRLRHNYTNQSITVLGDFTSRFWQSDLRIMSEKRSYPVEMTKQNKQMTIYPNGTVFSSIRTRSMNFCKMQFFRFPFDSQICEVRFETYGYSNDYLTLAWMDEDVKKSFIFLRNPFMEQLQVTAYTNYHEAFTYAGNGSGTHDQLVAVFYLKRPISFYLIRLYLPNVITVMLSWTSFWVDYRSLSARVTIGITTVLTINELRFNIYKDDTAAGRNLNLFDIYSFVCFVFVFAALIEYSIAQSVDIKYRLKDFYKARQAMKASDDILDYEDTVEQNITGASTNEQHQIPTRKFKGFKKFSLEYIDYRHSIVRDKYHALDKISQYVFPLTFVVINLVYVAMVVYLTNRDEDKTQGLSSFSWQE